MSAYLDLEDVCAGHPRAQKELDDLGAELEAVKSERDELRACNAELQSTESIRQMAVETLQRKLASANALITEMRKGEPVAWIYKRDDDRPYLSEIIKRELENFVGYGEGRPLYLAPVLPEGWKLFPPEITDEMFWAAENADFSGPEPQTRVIFRSFYESAPELPK